MINRSKTLERSILGAAFIALLVLGFFSWLTYRSLAQDKIWASRVRRQINPEETRAWALKSIALGDYGIAGAEAKFLLTNAPAYLLKKNYKRNPDVMVGHECIHLRYGGGLYSWGLTIGQTNLPASRARGSPAEKWADGIYFWNN